MISFYSIFNGSTLLDTNFQRKLNYYLYISLQLHRKVADLINGSSCMNIYAYSCLKLLSNRPDAALKQHNPCSNHEFHVAFEHVFYLNKNIIMSSFKSSRDIQRKRVGQTAVSDNQSSSVTLNELTDKESQKNIL